MVKLLRWFRLLNKRLYKKPAFVALLVMIPVLALLLSVVSDQDSGFLHIVICSDPNDPIAREAVDSLKSESGLISFTECSSPTEAEEMVRGGKTDAAWIFPEDLSEKIQSFSSSGGTSRPFITILERQSTVPLRLSCEKLSSALYRHCSKALYLSFVRAELPELDSMSDQKLLSYYDGFGTDSELFSLETVDSQNMGGKLIESGYLMAPVRGLLSIVAALGALAAALFYMEDEKRGSFAWCPSSRKFWINFACEIIAVSNVALAMLVSLFAANLAVGFLRELAAAVLYALTCAAFGMLVSRLVGSVKVLSALTPLLVIVMTAVCPVFFDFNIIEPLKLVFPPTYYIRAIFDDSYFLYGAAYAFCCLLLSAFIERLFKKS